MLIGLTAVYLCVSGDKYMYHNYGYLIAEADKIAKLRYYFSSLDRTVRFLGYDSIDRPLGCPQKRLESDF